MSLYIPDQKDLRRLEQISHSDGGRWIDIYSYLVAKAIEKLIVTNEFLRNQDNPVTSYKEIVHGVGYVYPQEIPHSELAQNDEKLLQAIINREPDDSIKKVDLISKFAPIVQFSSSTVLRTLKMLNAKLAANPQYRFEYAPRNELLDAIFNVKYHKFLQSGSDAWRQLIKLDPIYVIKFPAEGLVGEDFSDYYINNDLCLMFQEGIENYRQRYDIDERLGDRYRDESYTNPKDEKVKQLLKYLHHK